ncbi:3-phosphoshikimate 1-carboxyvinyltransferase [Psychroflexus aestuariivivens]|uniref:3-phosphoshikimate 1-carboxyvinyltransferase n=1 Tax=Psychroflexus aestuariivivens TaxID=1795040 RepID=UPI000FD78510|nr:3-phosphoshikimate 1-carboxyvinyltransferase [Psychroflexus aestuariivivens]
MKLNFQKPNSLPQLIKITGSKSISNRYLILQALYPKLKLEGLSESDDTLVLKKALESFQNSEVIDVHHAGTAMRFLTAFLATNANNSIVLTGSSRMQERPIGILVDALRDLGANIEYQKNTDFPPLKIEGRDLLKNELKIPANISSQFISALMLIAPSLKEGLNIQLTSNLTSRPYLEMTAKILKSIGIQVEFKDENIQISYQPHVDYQTVSIESDWSSASYFYSALALLPEGEIRLAEYHKDSIQGDAKVAEIYKQFGIETQFKSNTIKLSKNKDFTLPKFIQLDLNDTPDLAQTIAVTCLGLNISCILTGLQTLKVKETDRLQALKNEIEKFGAEVNITDSTLEMKTSSELNSGVKIETYNDHRMAMSFAPLAIKTDLHILNPKVVTKSFPDFWVQINALGIKEIY